MKYDAMLDECGKHHRIKGFDKMTANQKAEAVKKASGKQFISEAYDAIKGKSKEPSRSETVETPKKVEYIQPGHSPSTSHTVDVGAPIFNVNVPPPQVHVTHGNLTWSQWISKAFLWTNGCVVGSLFTALLFLWTAVNAAP
jgi:hypothetical protein